LQGSRGAGVGGKNGDYLKLKRENHTKTDQKKVGWGRVGLLGQKTQNSGYGVLSEKIEAGSLVGGSGKKKIKCFPGWEDRLSRLG